MQAAQPVQPKSLIIALTGASGALYGRHLIRAVLTLPGQSSLLVSPAAIRVMNQEYGLHLQTPADLLQSIQSEIQDSTTISHSFEISDYRDIGARPASGSAHFDGMVICPCSMKTLAAVAHGYTSNLVERAADVTLKERRPLIVVPRETPYSLIHLKNMMALTEAGGIVLAASPGFYQKPKTFDDLGRFIAGRILALLGFDQNLFPAWQGDSNSGDDTSLV